MKTRRLNHINTDLTEEQLLRFLARGNKGALRELYNRYWHSLYIQSRKVVQDELSSEDVVQEVFIDLWEKSKFEKIQDLAAYLHQAVKNKSLMALRKNKITSHHLEVFRSIQPQYAYDHTFQEKDLYERIKLHLENLPPRCREVFYKSRFEHLQNDEIATQLNISKRTVETHISHALRHLRGIKELLMVLLLFTL